MEKFLKEGGAKADTKTTKADQATPSKGPRKERETPARAGGYDEQQVSELRAVSTLSKLFFNTILI